VAGRAVIASSGRVRTCDAGWEAITGVGAGGDLIARVRDADADWLGRLLRRNRHRIAVAVRFGRSDAIVRSLLHLEGEPHGDGWHVVARRSVQPRPLGDDIEASVGAMRVTGSLHDAVWVASIADGRVVYGNDPWRDLAARDPDDDDPDWLGWILPDDRNRIRAEAASWLAGGAAGQLRQAFRARRADGAIRRLVGVASAIHGDDGTPAFASCVAMDLTDLPGLCADADVLAQVDPLTGLLDRRGLEAVLADVVERCARGDSAALLLLDLDCFKALNDTRGHAAGDDLLRSVGHRMRGALREGDHAARVGGDEFAVVLRRAESSVARAAATRILGAVELARLPGLDPLLSVQASGGLALLAPGSRLDPQEALLRADLALQEAKSSNRGGIVEYPTADRDAATRLRTRASWARRLYAALEQNRLMLVGQPIVDVERETVAVLAVELRLDDDGDVPADELRLHARQAGLEEHLDQWALRRAIEAVPGCDPADGGTLAIRVAAAVLEDRSLLPRLHNDLLHAGVAPERIALSLRGDTPIVAEDIARTSARGLRRLGVGLLMDGFGSRHGSLELLRSLPFSGLRIHTAFTSADRANPVDDAVVRYAVDLGEAFDLAVAADGVASHGDLERLRELGVRAASGPLLGEARRIDTLGAQA
jgi:diguanylate cyclase (GGDEF)-like protein